VEKRWSKNYVHIDGVYCCATVLGGTLHGVANADDGERLLIDGLMYLLGLYQTGNAGSAAGQLSLPSRNAATLNWEHGYVFNSAVSKEDEIPVGWDHGIDRIEKESLVYRSMELAPLWKELCSMLSFVVSLLDVPSYQPCYVLSLTFAALSDARGHG
jgi:hypothetical protein